MSKAVFYSLLWSVLLPFTQAATVAPEVAELSFGSHWAGGQIPANAKLPAWITGVQQEGGEFVNEPHAWKVEATAAKGTGRMEITLDRARIVSGNLVVTLLFDADENADVALQLFDSQGRAVVVDLFGNVVDIGRQATTDTFVVPLSKYPGADRLVIRRVSGGLRLHGLVLYPIVTEGPMEQAALQELARVLGDPLSPENPLVPRIQNIARSSRVEVSPVKPAAVPEDPSRPFHAPAAPHAGSALAAPTQGLLAHLSFDQMNVQDSSGLNNHGVLQGGGEVLPGDARGAVLNLRKNPTRDRNVVWDSVIIPSDHMPKLHDRLSLCAWVRYRSIAGTWGSQIIWHGDSRFGRDPWVLHLLPSGRAEFRSDRSVMGRPKFTVFEDEI